MYMGVDVGLCARYVHDVRVLMSGAWRGMVIYVYMCICMYVYAYNMSVCMYVCMHIICLYVCMYAYMFVISQVVLQDAIMLQLQLAMHREHEAAAAAIGRFIDYVYGYDTYLGCCRRHWLVYRLRLRYLCRLLLPPPLVGLSVTVTIFT